MPLIPVQKTTIVIPGTTQAYRDNQGDAYPLRVMLHKNIGLPEDTDLLVDQIRAISNARFWGMQRLLFYQLIT